jgi:hypothetical protein
MSPNIFIRYYLQSASERGYNEHPVKVMQNLGFKLVKGIPESIADLWFFEVEYKAIIPEWLDVVEDVESLPEWKIAYKY